MGGLDHLAVRTWLFASRHTCMPPEGDCHTWVVGLRPHLDSSKRTTPCPLYPRKRTCAVQPGMSALGHKRTCAAQKSMSALPSNRGRDNQGLRQTSPPTGHRPSPQRWGRRRRKAGCSLVGPRYNLKACRTRVRIESSKCQKPSLARNARCGHFLWLRLYDSMNTKPVTKESVRAQVRT